MKKTLIMLICGFSLSSCGQILEMLSPSNGNSTGTNIPNPSYDIVFDSFSSCDELQKAVRDQLLTKKGNDQAKERAMIAAPQTNSSTSIISDKSTFTNVQEKGVDESDHTKIGDNHVFVSHAGRIEVADRKSLKYLGVIEIAELTNLNLFVDGDRLFVIGSRAERTCGGSEFNLMPNMSPPEPDNPQCVTDGTTTVKIYEGKEGKVPSLIKEHVFKGLYLDSRYTAGRIVLLFKQVLNLKPDFRPFLASSDASLSGVDIPDEPINIDQSASQRGVTCQSIAKAALNDLDFRVTKIASISGSDIDEEPKLLGVLGGGDNIYMTQTSLYITKLGLVWVPWKDDPQNNAETGNEGGAYALEDDDHLIVTKVSFGRSDGSIAVSAVGQIEGRVKDQWAFKEIDENTLSVATTTGRVSTGTSVNLKEASNHLWILKQNDRSLEAVAAVRGFAKGEDIRSVRYIGNFAYVVTFKKTDPLFAFDLSDPLKPALLGELTVPGFSTYLHPARDGLLVGIGFDALDLGENALFQGVQISLFDISNPQKLARLDNHVIGVRGSYSDAAADHHAFYFDASRQMFGLPAVELDGDTQAAWSMQRPVKFSGAIIYKIGDASLSEVARISHEDFIPSYCKSLIGNGQWWQSKVRSIDINRLYEVDGRLLSISRFGIKAHNPASPNELLVSEKFNVNGESMDCLVVN